MNNLHVNLDEANKHTPKGFDPATTNTRPWKDEQGLSTYDHNNIIPDAINFVDGTVAPPTTVNGDIYVLTGAGTVDSGWGAATFGDWVRFSNSIANPITPINGALCFDTTAGVYKLYDGSVWGAFGAPTATNLTEGTTTPTTVNVDSSTGTNATLLAASTLRAGVMSNAKFDEVVLNNAKVSNVSTNISTAFTATEVTVESSDGLDAIITGATALLSGVLTAAKFSEIVANTLKVSFPEAPNNGTQYARKNLGWEAVAAPSGPFAIFNSAGVPTYYTTLALVLAAASSGDTVQQFADVTETVSSNALPANVNWNLNGFTYEKTAGSYSVSIPTNSKSKITNGRIFANGSGNCIDAPSANQDLYFDGLILESTAEAIRCGANANIHNVTIIGNSNTLPIVNGGSYHNSIIKGSGSGRTTDVCQNLTKCEITSNNTNAVYRLNGTAYDCRIHTDGSVACSGPTFRGVRCTITSAAGHGVNVATAELEDCFSEGKAETGVTASNGFAIGCTIKGVSIDFGFRTAFGPVKVERSTITNSAGRGFDMGANSQLINSVVRSTFNSANGDSIRINNGLIAGTAPVITNCSLEVVNTSANYLYSSFATVANYSNIVSIDKLVVTTPVTANITQGNAASDTEGNNF